MVENKRFYITEGNMMASEEKSLTRLKVSAEAVLDNLPAPSPRMALLYARVVDALDRQGISPGVDLAAVLVVLGAEMAEIESHHGN